MNSIPSYQKKPSIMPWLIWGVAASYTLYQFLLQVSTSVMVPCLMQAFSINETGVGFLSSAFFYSYVILQIPSGILMDRYGVKKVLTISIILCVLMTLVFAKAQHLATAEISRFIMGAAAAPAVVASLRLAADWFPPGMFALMAGLTEMLGMIGGALGQIFLAQCVGRFGWRDTLLVGVVVGIVLIIYAILILTEKPKQSATNEASQNIFEDIISLLSLPQLWFASLICGLLFAVLTGFGALWSVPYLMVRYHISLALSASASSMIFWGAAVGTPVAGWLTDLIKRRKIVMWFAVIGTFVFTLLTVYWISAPLFVMFFLLFALGFFIGGYVVPFALVSDLVPNSVHGTAMGFVNMMCILIGAPVLQPTIGLLLDVHHRAVIVTQHAHSLQDYTSAFITLPICLVIAVVIMFFIKETNCEKVVLEKEAAHAN